jgi:uncharacterized membrane protein
MFTLLFFYGNMRYIDCFFDEIAQAPHAASRLMFDLAVIVIESLLLASSSFFINAPHDLFLTIVVLLGLDVVWFILSQLFVTTRDPSPPTDPILQRRQLYWELNNLITLLVIIAVVVGAHREVSLVASGASVLAINWLVTAYTGRHFYLGTG